MTFSWGPRTSNHGTGPAKHKGPETGSLGLTLKA